MFPCLNSKYLIEVQPIVQAISKEFGVQYNYFDGNPAIKESVYKQFKKMGQKPTQKTE